MKYGYICLYQGKKFEVFAGSLYEAKKAAVNHFKGKKKKLKDSHLISVVLAEKEGNTILHTPNF